jgi:uncharacterized protein YfaS (alpha-2-macroglobulin family)
VYLQSHAPQTIDDAYVLALVANALVSLDPQGGAARPYLARLCELKRASADGKRAWWTQESNGRTIFYGAGHSGQVETTALSALALLRARHDPATARAALAWIVEQKDAHGGWHSTQATVLALKALLAATGKPLGDGADRQIDVAVDGTLVRTLAIPAERADVVEQVDLTSLAPSGRHRLTLTDRSGTGSGYHLLARHYLDEGQAAPAEGLSIELAYDRTELGRGESVQISAKVANRQSRPAPMVLIDLPIPAGFTVDEQAFDRLVTAGTIAKYQATPRSIVVYLRNLPPNEPLELSYRAAATLPAKVSVPPACVYEYYDPQKRAGSQAATLIVRE